MCSSSDAHLKQRMDTSPSTDYLEKDVLPLLTSGLEALLKEAQTHRCTEKRMTAFNGCDFLTEWLYNKNPRRTEHIHLKFHEIPFVQDWLLIHPRKSIPVFLLLTDEQAALLIQAYWRGYKVRVRPDVQELRQWQRELREENSNINKTVQEFWARQENRVWSELVELGDDVEQHLESGVSIEVVPPTPQSRVLYTPALQSTLERQQDLLSASHFQHHIHDSPVHHTSL